MSKDFSEAILFLQNLPTYEWNGDDMNIFISQAHLLREQYSNSHLFQ